MINNRHIKNFYCNILNISNLIKLTDDAFILMYHRVINDFNDIKYPIQPGMYVTGDSLEKQLQVLSKKYNIISLVELLEKYYSGRNVNNCCAITFDDGWIDNYFNAVPILDKFNTPASFFLATDYIDSNKWFWSEHISYFISNVEHSVQREMINQLKLPNNLLEHWWSKKDNGDKITQIVKMIKYLKEDIKQSLIVEVEIFNKKLIIDKPLFMKKTQIIDMNKNTNYDFFPHTHNHEVLTTLNIKDIEFEVKNSKRIIQELTDTKQDLLVFSYPSGRTNSIIKNVLIKNGFEYAVVTTRGKILTSKNKMEINRIGIHDDISFSDDVFKYYLYKSQIQ